MTVSNWIAIAGSVVAVVSLGLGVSNFRRQARRDKLDAEDELADQITAIQHELAKLTEASATDRSIDVISRITTVNGALQGLVLRVARLITHYDLRPDWFQTVVLANAYVSIGEIAGGETWVARAVELARAEQQRFDADDPQRPVSALVWSLRLQGIYYYRRAKEGDAARGARAFEEARVEVGASRSQQGPVMTQSQQIELLVGQASGELGIGGTAHAATLIRQAGEEWQKITVPGARVRLGEYLATFLASEPSLATVALDLPAEFTAEVARLSSRARGPAMAPDHMPSVPYDLPDRGAMHAIVPPSASGAPGPAGPTART